MIGGSMAAQTAVDSLVAQSTENSLNSRIIVSMSTKHPVGLSMKELYLKKN
jgi:hypothetical protein